MWTNIKHSKFVHFQTMQEEYKKWMKFYGKTYSDYKVRVILSFKILSISLVNFNLTQVSFYLQILKGDFLCDEMKEYLNNAS